MFYFFFFFQAEDGIRDVAVTGVQTCALPICSNFSFKGYGGKVAESPFPPVPRSHMPGYSSTSDSAMATLAPSPASTTAGRVAMNTGAISDKCCGTYLRSLCEKKLSSCG